MTTMTAIPSVSSTLIEVLPVLDDLILLNRGKRHVDARVVAARNLLARYYMDALYDGAEDGLGEDDNGDPLGPMPAFEEAL